MTDIAGHFTGAVSAKSLAAPTEDVRLAVYAVTFDSGAHTHWHTHPMGQGLYVTNGAAIVHVEGQLPIHLNAGDSIWVEAGQRHWHGASPDGAMTHVAYQEAAKDGTTIEWHEPVPDSTYTQATKEHR